MASLHLGVLRPNILRVIEPSQLAHNIGGSGGRARRTPPFGTQFFRFCIHFHRKVPTSEVHAPLTGARPPTGNPGSATAQGYRAQAFQCMLG